MLRKAYIPAAGAAPAAPPPAAAAAAGAATPPPAGTEANLERPVLKRNAIISQFKCVISNSTAVRVLNHLPEFMTSLMSFPFSSLMTCGENNT